VIEVRAAKAVVGRRKMRDFIVVDGVGLVPSMKGY
jgi:hypothetical protein